MPLYDLAPHVLFEAKTVELDKLAEAQREYQEAIYLPSGLTIPAADCHKLAVRIARRLKGKIVHDERARSGHLTAIETADEESYVASVNAENLRRPS